MQRTSTVRQREGYGRGTGWLDLYRVRMPTVMAEYDAQTERLVLRARRVNAQRDSQRREVAR
jgi:hypothetical protein